MRGVGSSLSAPLVTADDGGGEPLPRGAIPCAGLGGGADLCIGLCAVVVTGLTTGVGVVARGAICVAGDGDGLVAPRGGAADLDAGVPTRLGEPALWIGGLVGVEKVGLMLGGGGEDGGGDGGGDGGAAGMGEGRPAPIGGPPHADAEKKRIATPIERRTFGLMRTPPCTNGADVGTERFCGIARCAEGSTGAESERRWIRPAPVGLTADRRLRFAPSALRRTGGYVLRRPPYGGPAAYQPAQPETS